MRVSLPATLVVMLLTTAFISPAAATPISYSESVSGDLGQELPAPTVFTLDVGVNTVSGTSAFDPFNPDFDFDSFALSVPVGTVVTNISYAFVRGGSAIFGNTSFIVGNGNTNPIGGPGPILAQQGVDLFGASPVVMFASGLPLSAGTYSIQNFALGAGGDGGWTDDYTWSLTVESTATVPEPASLVLLGSGLIGAGTRRWRTRRKDVHG